MPERRCLLFSILGIASSRDDPEGIGDRIGRLAKYSRATTGQIGDNERLLEWSMNRIEEIGLLLVEIISSENIVQRTAAVRCQPNFERCLFRRLIDAQVVTGIVGQQIRMMLAIGRHDRQGHPTEVSGNIGGQAPIMAVVEAVAARRRHAAAGYQRNR